MSIGRIEHACHNMLQSKKFSTLQNTGKCCAEVPWACAWAWGAQGPAPAVRRSAEPACSSHATAKEASHSRDTVPTPRNTPLRTQTAHFCPFWLGAQPVIPNWGVGWPSQPGPARPRNQDQCISVSRQDSNAPVGCSWGCTGFEMIVVFGDQVYPASRTFWASNPGFSRAPCYRVGCHWHHKIGLGLLHRWV